jgi:Xaa-Pro dipeptidase
MPLYDPASVASVLDESAYGALLATTPANVLYLARFRKAGGTVAVVTRDAPERATLILPSSSIDFLLEDPGDEVEPVPYGRFYRAFADGERLEQREQLVKAVHERTRWGQDLGTVAAAVLEAAGAGSGPVAADAHSDTRAALQRAAPDLKVVPEPTLFARLRMLKTPGEVERLSEAARITEAAIAASTRTIRVGATQREIAAAFRRSVVAEEAEIRADNVSIDRGAALGNVNWPDDRVRDGSVVRYDVGAIHRGYAADIARCFSASPPEVQVARRYEAVRRGQAAALEVLRPGVRASQLFEAAVAATREAGLPHYERTHVGHGIGIAGGYDPPLLAPDDHTVIEAGMVLCVETPYYEVGRHGLQVEDMVVVTDDGFEFLSHSSRDLEVIGS